MLRAHNPTRKRKEQDVRYRSFNLSSTSPFFLLSSTFIAVTMLSNMELSQRSGSPNNQEWQHGPIQSPRETTSILPSCGSFDPPPPPSPTRVYVSPTCFRRNRTDEDSFLNCKNYSSASFSTSTMELSRLALPSLDFSTGASTRSQETISLRPRLSYFTPGVPDHVSARDRRANVARILSEALLIMEDYCEENADDGAPVNNF